MPASIKIYARQLPRSRQAGFRHENRCGMGYPSSVRTCREKGGPIKAGGGRLFGFGGSTENVNNR